jgi:putative transposase
MSAFSSGVRFALYPTSPQATLLRQWIGCQRVIYNSKVAEEQYFNTFRRKSLALAGARTPLDQQYSQFKSDLTPWLSEVPSQVLRNGAFRWMGAKQRQLKGLAGAPVRKRAHGRQSVLITSELFEFVPVDSADPSQGHRLLLGTPKFPVGELRFSAHRPYQIPKQIVISVEAGRWFVGFSFEQPSPLILRTPEELAYEFNNLTDEQLARRTTGYDRGVVNRLADSNEVQYPVDEAVQRRIARKEARKRKYQRKMARQVKGSNNRAKTKAKLASLQNYRKRCAQDWAHKVTYKMVTGGTQIHVLEALKVRNMTKRPKAKQVNGKWVKNGAAAKAGLNKAILGSVWGRVSTYVQYKAARRNQLVLFVPPQFSSQECSECTYTHPDNRPSQAEFVCQRCGHAEHADTNASRVLKKRGIAALRAGIVAKPLKRVAMRRQNKAGAGCPGVSVERPDKTRAGKARTAHTAKKQKVDNCEVGSPFL